MSGLTLFLLIVVLGISCNDNKLEKQFASQATNTTSTITNNMSIPRYKSHRFHR
jgi:hypothetical protein